MKTLAFVYAISNWFVSLQAAINPFIYRNIRKLYKEHGGNTEIFSTISTSYSRLKRRMSRNGLGNLPGNEFQEKIAGAIEIPQDIECLLNPAQFDKYVPPCPLATCLEGEECAILQMIYHGYYFRRDSSSELVSTTV